MQKIYHTERKRDIQHCSTQTIKCYTTGLNITHKHSTFHTDTQPNF